MHIATRYKVGERVLHITRKTTWCIYDTILSTPIKYVLLRYMWDNVRDKIKLMKIVSTYKELKKVK